MSRIIAYEDVLKIPALSVCFVDVREADEISATGLIPGSVHIPMGSVEAELVKLDADSFEKKYGMEKPGLESDIVITCRSGRRAEIVVNNLENMGYKNCKFYKGSWLEWESNQQKN